MGREVGDARHGRQTGPVRKRHESSQLNIFGVALKIESVGFRVEIAFGDDVTGAEAYVNGLDIDVRPVERGTRRHAFKCFTGEPTWSKAKVRTAAHRVRNS